MNKYRVWTSKWQLYVKADSLERVEMETYTILRFKQAGSTVAEIDSFCGWALDEKVSAIEWNI